MLYEFLTANRAALIERCRTKVARRSAPEASAAELEHGVSLFLDQLVKTLQVEQTPEPMASRKVSGPAGGGADLSEIGESAAQHGRELLQHGFKVDQVVHDYGDLCQAITDLAFEQSAPISIDEFRTLNRCLDNAIAGAVTEYAYQHDSLIADKTARSLNERLGSFAHELRNLLHTAKLAVTAMKSGNVGHAGATGAVLDRSLIGLGRLIDRSLADVRASAGVPAQHQCISLSDFIEEVRISASLEAETRGCRFTVSGVDATLAVFVDRDLLLSAVGNLLHNAFKFTQRHTEVSLRAYAAADRILIEVEDHCGGLPTDGTEKIFLPFTQGSADKSGMGLGLSICQRSVEANHGMLSVRDVPGSGCIFTIDLPRHLLQEPPLCLQAIPLSSRTGRGEILTKIPRILIVDDSEDTRSIMVRLLDRDGYEVRVAANGTEALKAQAQTPFDVLITDIFMPDKDGVETIHEFHHKYPHTSIIAMSAVAHTQVDYLLLSLEIGACRILRKPFDVAALYTALKEVLAEREPQGETM